jgi:predicted small metal-binding protein
MAKVLRCKDVGMDCNFEARGETVDDVMKQAAPHAKEVHKMDSIPPEVEQKIRASIRDENPTNR